jgi:hypothetical protein
VYASNRRSPAIMRAFLALLFWLAIFGIAVVFVTAAFNCLHAPLLLGPREEATQALVDFWSRSALCAACLLILIISRKRWQRGHRKRENTNTSRREV